MIKRCGGQLILVAVLGLAGCYEPSFETCTIACALDGGDPCPAGLECDGQMCAAIGTSCVNTSEPYHRLIAAGDEHSCAIIESGIVCWGSNTRGQLTLAAVVVDSPPVPVTPPIGGRAGTWTSIVAGRAHTCAMFSPDGMDPEIYCWGDGSDLQLGDVMATPQFFGPSRPAESRWIGIGAGDRHSCAIAEHVSTTAQSVHCWGANDLGQLDGFPGASVAPVLVPMPALPAAPGWRMVAGGAGHTCAISTTADVVCWGDNAMGQLGHAGSESTPQLTAGRFGIIAAGADHTCGITAAGLVECWGDNTGSRLGTSSAAPTLAAPTPVSGQGAMPGWIAIDSGPLATCGTRGGITYCWGEGHPQTGLGTLSSGQSVPTAAVVNTTATGLDVAVTAISACAHEGGSNVQCWGDSLHGELGDGTRTIEWTPVEILPPMLSGWYSVFTGRDATCAIALQGVLYRTYCWGNSSHDQILGARPPGVADVVVMPTALDSPTNQIRGVGLGDRHTCVVYDTGLQTVRVACWGDDTLAQNPADMPGLQFDLMQSANPQITADGHFTCVTGSDTRHPQCWGTAQSGTVTTSNVVLAPNVELRPATVNWGGDSACGIANSGMLRVYCFGTEAVGEMGDGAPPTSSAWPDAVLTQNTLNWSFMARGPGRTRCVSEPAAGIYCWGDNTHGQVTPAAPGGWVDVPVETVAPGMVPSLTDLTMGGSHGCARINGTNNVRCWGGFDVGQRTRLPTSPAFNDITIAPVGAWNSIRAGGSHTCAIADNTRLFCWGRNTYGQIGNGPSARPVAGPISPP